MKILIIGNRFIGDSIMTLDTVASLYNYYPESCFDLLSHEHTFEIYKNLNIFHKIIKYKKLNLSKLLSLILQLKKKKYDLCLIFPGGFIYALIAILCGIKKRIGHNTDYRNFLLTDSVTIDNQINNSLNFKNLLTVLDRKILYTTFTFKMYQKNYLKTDNILKKNDIKQVYVIAPGASHSGKMWSADKFIELVNRLKKRKIIPVFIGSKNEKQYIDNIIKYSAGYNLAGKFSFSEIIQLFLKADIFIGNNSGLSHLAAKCDIPTVVISGNSNINLTQPLGKSVYIITKNYPCSPCSVQKLNNCHHKKCILNITVDDVYSVITNEILR